MGSPSDTDPLESGVIILVIRKNIRNKILNFVTYALPILNGSISVGEKLNIEIPFQDATNEPEVTEVYFTKSLWGIYHEKNIFFEWFSCQVNKEIK